MTFALHLTNTPHDRVRDAYLEAWRDIDAHGLHHPVGRKVHVAWSVGDVLHVVDVWDSAEQQAAFMRDLGPILDAFGMELVEPIEAGELLQIVLAPGSTAQSVP